MNVHVRGSRLVVPYDGRIVGLFPEAIDLTVKDKKLLVLNHGLPETALLRRLDYDVPAPVLTQYDWCGGTPFDVQRKTVGMMTTN